MFSNGLHLNQPGRVCASLGLAFLSVFGLSCGQKDVGPPPRYAVVGFENLSGDPSLDWAGRGAAEYLSGSLEGAINGAGFISRDALERAAGKLGGHVPSAPGISAERASAVTAGANRIIAGYVERTSAGVRIAASEEDASTHRTVRVLSAEAPTAFEALGRLAHQFSAQVGQPPSGNPEAFRLYATALQGNAADAIPLLERAVELDPSFGRAWASLVQVYVAAGNRDQAASTIRRARQRKLTPVDIARLDIEDASLRGDHQAVKAAMEKLIGVSRGDSDLAQTLAEEETVAGNFAQAAADWKKMTVGFPDVTNGWNQLGYTLCWSGDYAGALAALREYERLSPGNPNPLDSQGDVHYWFGKYADAAISYAAAYVKSPALLNGGDLYKGAWAKFRAGDKAGADALFARFRDLREKAKDPEIILIAGDWLYRTGREKEAAALLREEANKDAPTGQLSRRSEIGTQLAVWDLLAGDRAAAAKDAASGGTGNISPGDFVVRFVAQPSATEAVWQARASQVFAPPQLAGLRDTALGYALVLDGKKQAAIPVWEQIVKEAPATDFFPRAMLARLKGQRLEHDAAPDPVGLTVFLSVLEKL